MSSKATRNITDKKEDGGKEKKVTKENNSKIFSVWSKIIGITQLIFFFANFFRMFQIF